MFQLKKQLKKKKRAISRQKVNLTKLQLVYMFYIQAIPKDQFFFNLTYFYVSLHMYTKTHVVVNQQPTKLRSPIPPWERMELKSPDLAAGTSIH